jgi:hypothetical protein
MSCPLLIPKGRLCWNFLHLWQNISSRFAKGLVAHISTHIGCIVFCTDKLYVVLSSVCVALRYACYVMNSKSINPSFFCCSCRFLLYNAARNIIDAMFGEWAVTYLYRLNVNLSAGKINNSKCVCFLAVKPMEKSFLRNWWLLSSSRIFPKFLRFEVSL